MEKLSNKIYNSYSPSGNLVFNSKESWTDFNTTKVSWKDFNTSTSVPNTKYNETFIEDVYTNDPNKLKGEEKGDFVRKVMVNPSFSEVNSFYVDKKKEKVNHPSHYNNKGKETIKVLEDYLSKEEYEGFLKGNILKYIHRYETKNGLEDLNKAKWYLEELIRITTPKKENK